ncbi:hypothetical protein [Thermomonospora umbrina]|uniref:hypothetical protein n=1 Tax=Thermomonospora umbrina TaxID=111806 RepID=UPI001476A10F|nr:hypothetical protein [Thermomonospora umbrina]
MTGRSIGTPVHMAPERVGDGDVGPAADPTVCLYRVENGRRTPLGDARRVGLVR